jgi:hypothetical protein
MPLRIFRAHNQKVEFDAVPIKFGISNTIFIREIEELFILDVVNGELLLLLLFTGAEITWSKFAKSGDAGHSGECVDEHREGLLSNSRPALEDSS